MSSVDVPSDEGWHRVETVWSDGELHGLVVDGSLEFATDTYLDGVKDSVDARR